MKLLQAEKQAKEKQSQRELKKNKLAFEQKMERSKQAQEKKTRKTQK